eukprot:1444878-Rhodomonas_salina.9
MAKKSASAQGCEQLDSRAAASRPVGSMLSALTALGVVIRRIRVVMSWTRRANAETYPVAIQSPSVLQMLQRVACGDWNQRSHRRELRGGTAYCSVVANAQPTPTTFPDTAKQYISTGQRGVRDGRREIPVAIRALRLKKDEELRKETSFGSATQFLKPS